MCKVFSPHTPYLPFPCLLSIFSRQTKWHHPIYPHFHSLPHHHAHALPRTTTRTHTGATLGFAHFHSTLGVSFVSEPLAYGAATWRNTLSSCQINLHLCMCTHRDAYFEHTCKHTHARTHKYSHPHKTPHLDPPIIHYNRLQQKSMYTYMFLLGGCITHESTPTPTHPLTRSLSHSLSRAHARARSLSRSHTYVCI